MSVCYNDYIHKYAQQTTETVGIITVCTTDHRNSGHNYRGVLHLALVAVSGWPRSTWRPCRLMTDTHTEHQRLMTRLATTSATPHASSSSLHSRRRLSHRCTTMSTVDSTPHLQRSPMEQVESFRSWSSHLFRGRPGGWRHVQLGGRFSDTLMWS